MATQYDFTVTIHDSSDRADMWMQVFGRLTVPVRSFIPKLVNLPEFDEPQPVYFLRDDSLTSEERQKLIDAIVDKFGADRAEVIDSLNSRGMPILASDCIVTVNHPHKWID